MTFLQQKFDLAILRPWMNGVLITNFSLKNWFRRNDLHTFHNFNFLSPASGFTLNGAQHSNEAEEAEDAIFFYITPKMSWLVWFVIEIGNNSKRRCFFLILSSVGAAEIIEVECRLATGNFCSSNICGCMVNMKTSRQKVHFSSAQFLSIFWTFFRFSRHSLISVGTAVVQLSRTKLA